MTFLFIILPSLFGILPSLIFKKIWLLVYIIIFGLFVLCILVPLEYEIHYNPNHVDTGGGWAISEGISYLYLMTYLLGLLLRVVLYKLISVLKKTR